MGWSPYYFKWGGEFQSLGLLWQQGYLNVRESFECPGRRWRQPNYMLARDPELNDFVFAGYARFMPSYENFYSERMGRLSTRTYNAVFQNNVAVRAALACYFPIRQNGLPGGAEAALPGQLPHLNRGGQIAFFDGSVDWLRQNHYWGSPYKSAGHDPWFQGNARYVYRFWMLAHDLR